MTDTAFGRAGGRDGDLALAAYLEPVIEGRRLLVLGGLTDAIRDKLAGVVDELEVVESDALEGDLDLPFAGRYFDAVWLVDSALLNPTPDALAELKRVLARDGALIVCSSINVGSKRHQRGTPEERLSRVLWPEFVELRLLRQSAVHAHALEEIDGGAEVAVDSSLLEGAQIPIERIVAIASDVHLRLDSRLWVQLPGVDSHEDDSLRELLTEAVERAKTLSLTLDAAEADLEDAFTRARSIDAQLAEKDAAAAHEREHRIRAERALEHAKAEVEVERKRVASTLAERDAARAEIESATTECTDLEERLAERGAHIQMLEVEQKRSETTARDLIEDLRRIEHERTTSAEHNGRVTELEGEISRAVARALEAEVSREAALMRVDELRARIVRLEAEPPAPAPGPSVDPALEGTLYGLRMRLRELEQTLSEAAKRADTLPRQDSLPVADRVADVHASASEQVGDHDRGEIAGLTLRLAEAERALEHVSGYEARIRSLERELEEADRFAESHADDVDRIEALEAELTRAQHRFDDIEDDLRATQDELRVARAEVDHLAVETSARVELAQRRENEARNERDQARAALEEARGILAQLTGKVNAEVTDPSVS